MAQAQLTHNVVSSSYGGGDRGGSATVDVAGNQYLTAPAASTSMAPSSHESSLYVTAGLSDVQIRAAIEKSKDQGWSELVKVGTGTVAGAGSSLSDADALIWAELKKKYPRLFRDNVKVKLGRVIAEGGQAHICEAQVIHDVRGALGAPHRYVAKVFKMDGFSLADFKRQWPLVDFGNGRNGIFRNAEPIFVTPYPFCTNVDFGVFLEDGRFAFLMRRCWGDLRTFIDLQLKNQNSHAPPFSDLESVKIIQHIAEGMDGLHFRGALHRDLNAANVLIRTNDRTFKQGDALQVGLNCEAWVADYESSLLVQGTGFWRAPEVLKELQKPPPRDQSAMIWTEKVDVYSYAMTCYEILPVLYLSSDIRNLIGIGLLFTVKDLTCLTM